MSGTGELTGNCPDVHGRIAEVRAEPGGVTVNLGLTDRNYRPQDARSLALLLIAAADAAEADTEHEDHA
jgi:hypothetical protein